MESFTAPTGRRQICRSPSQWCELFARFEQSGQTRVQFCAEHGLRLSTFDRWRRRLRQDGSVAREPSDEALFVEVAQNAPARSMVSWDVELPLGSGVVLRLRRIPC